MLSIKKCQANLKEYNLSDELSIDDEKSRENEILETIAEICFEKWLAKRKQQK